MSSPITGEDYGRNIDRRIEDEHPCDLDHDDAIVEKAPESERKTYTRDELLGYQSTVVNEKNNIKNAAEINEKFPGITHFQLLRGPSRVRIPSTERIHKVHDSDAIAKVIAKTGQNPIHDVRTGNTGETARKEVIAKADQTPIRDLRTENIGRTGPKVIATAEQIPMRDIRTENTGNAAKSEEIVETGPKPIPVTRTEYAPVDPMHRLKEDVMNKTRLLQQKLIQMKMKAAASTPQ